MKTERITPLLNPLITVTCVILAGYFFATQKTILLPIALGFLFALLLLPAVKKLESWKFPRALSAVVMIIFTVLIVLIIMGGLSLTLSQFIADLPNYAQQIKQNIGIAQQALSNFSGISIIDQNSWIDQNVNIIEIGAQNAGSIISGATAITSTLSLAFLYTFFMLYYRNKIKIFIQKLLGGEQEKNILDVIKKMGGVIPNYLTGVLKVMGILAVMNTFGLWLIGIHNPMFWGIFIAVLNIIPYVGTLVGFVGLIFITLITQGIPFALGAFVLFIITQFIDNNILTPQIAGGNININPLAAIVSIIIFGSLWGTVGMMLALPFIGIIKIIADSIPDYQAWGYLLGDENEYEPSPLEKKITSLITFKK